MRLGGVLPRGLGCQTSRCQRCRRFPGPPRGAVTTDTTLAADHIGFCLGVWAVKPRDASVAAASPGPPVAPSPPIPPSGTGPSVVVLEVRLRRGSYEQRRTGGQRQLVGNGGFVRGSGTGPSVVVLEVRLRRGSYEQRRTGGQRQLVGNPPPGSMAPLFRPFSPPAVTGFAAIAAVAAVAAIAAIADIPAARQHGPAV